VSSERHPNSAPGDFYVINHECMSCGAPHEVAPDLIGWSSPDQLDHCIWKKQPETDEELEQAFAAFDVSCIAAYRYAGSNPKIIARLGSEYCDGSSPQAIHTRATGSRFPTGVGPGPSFNTLPVKETVLERAKRKLRFWLGS
jgi:hypothetical protein